MTLISKDTFVSNSVLFTETTSSAKENTVTRLAIEAIEEFDQAAQEENRAKKLKFRRLMNSCILRNTPQALLEFVQSAQPTRELYQEAVRIQSKNAENPTLSVHFVSAEWGGESEGDLGIIHIAKTIPFQDKARIFLFELVNIIQWSRFTDIRQKVCDGVITQAEEYAMAIEKIEYESAAILSEILQDCIKDFGWPASFDIHSAYLETEGATFHKHLEYARKTGHFDYYVQQFYEFLPITDKTVTT